MLSDYSVGL